MRLVRSAYHYCKGGKNSGLREGSGAAFVYERVPEHIHRQFCYEFEIIPHPPNIQDISPKYLCDVGYSDSVACALAVAQAQLGRATDTTAPLVLISCSFAPHACNQGLKNLVLGRVSSNDGGEAMASLYNKWCASQANKALAMVLHEDDAEELQKMIGRRVLPLTEDVFEGLGAPEEPVLISCKSDQLESLIKALRLPAALFAEEVNRPGSIPASADAAVPTLKRKAGNVALAIFSLLIVLISAKFLWPQQSKTAAPKETLPPELYSASEPPRSEGSTKIAIPLCAVGFLLSVSALTWGSGSSPL